MTTPSVLDKLQALTNLYQKGYQSALVEQSLNKIIELEKDHLNREIQSLSLKIKGYEDKYQLASQDFYLQFMAGELGDSMDFMEWSVFYELLEVAQSRLETLQSIHS
ncbi:MAG: hypothetical protein VKL42_00885 [Snowella sp.]|nr:hypothetical protein [Snowella sp.]